ncbi:MAG TPA: LysE family translocator [Acidisphaera sp.]|nr:LysE family translocator [Acidisphaera sp.]
MIDPGLYAAFAGACVLLMLIPGPNVALITANAIAYGVRTGLLTVCATATALALQLVLVTAGLAALLTAASSAFVWLRWAGVAYLIWLGVKQWRTVARDEEMHPRPLPVRHIVARAAAVGLTNPKTLLFYAALFPQFIDPHLRAGPQIVILGVTLVAIALIVDGLWAMMAARARGVLLRRARLRNRLTGGLLIGAGVSLAIVRSD